MKLHVIHVSSAPYIQVLSTVNYSQKIPSLCSLLKVSEEVALRCKSNHSAVCLTTGPQPPPKTVLHRVRSIASSFNLQYHVFSLRYSGTQVCGFKPGRNRWIFTGVKFLSMPSSGGEVKESVPCPRFAACKRT